MGLSWWYGAEKVCELAGGVYNITYQDVTSEIKLSLLISCTKNICLTTRQHVVCPPMTDLRHPTTITIELREAIIYVSIVACNY
jgi:hypothetical protein